MYSKTVSILYYREKFPQLSALTHNLSADAFLFSFPAPRRVVDPDSFGVIDAGKITIRHPAKCRAQDNAHGVFTVYTRYHACQNITYKRRKGEIIDSKTSRDIEISSHFPECMTFTRGDFLL